MPVINTQHLKHGLLPVQEAATAWREAVALRDAAAPTDLPAAREAAEKALKAYTDACVSLFGYVEGAVRNAEAEASRKK